MVTNRGHARRQRGSLRSGGPLDPVLDHPPLQRMTSDTQQLSSLDDTARSVECLLAQQPLGFAEVEVFQEDRHVHRICEIELVGNPYRVFSPTFPAGYLTAQVHSIFPL